MIKSNLIDTHRRLDKADYGLLTMELLLKTNVGAFIVSCAVVGLAIVGAIYDATSAAVRGMLRA